LPLAPPISGLTLRLESAKKEKAEGKNSSVSIQRNPLITLVSDERIQGNPRKSNVQNLGFS
jgi:hypothetical protein